ncbi:hypothetical protein SAMN05216226_11232 [Halovenus aranensis]|jgi:hypothetical protein|uniref:Uncharacterized protein n=1 Tax=Halovenus aranensis TaxID=890420 RepID=A0A1G8XR75_9EURY|nr:hypothetical protein [Halovenus aranensis]SDJ92963.1 hypothetical protein SAMN05216226_11232 [Halovenus aranensis]
MATETGEGPTEDVSGEDTTDETSAFSDYERSAIVTTGATLGGIVAAFASELYIGDPQSRTALLLVAAAVFVQFPLYRLIGLDVDDFGIKGNLYIALMTFILWFLTWGIILTTGAVDAL